jgi:NMD protein affecting ribosome stability and mRNA decay
MKAIRPAGLQKRRRATNWSDHQHDAYQTEEKLAQPTICPECRAVYHKGRWQWMAAPARAHQTLCPACRRIHDDFPAGYVTLSGRFLDAHKQEIMELVKNTQARARSEHALQRIIKILQQPNQVEITTTDSHLARTLGEALHRAYQGELELNYNQEDALARVSWSRDT